MVSKRIAHLKEQESEDTNAYLLGYGWKACTYFLREGREEQKMLEVEDFDMTHIRNDHQLPAALLAEKYTVDERSQILNIHVLDIVLGECNVKYFGTNCRSAKINTVIPNNTNGLTH